VHRVSVGSVPDDPILIDDRSVASDYESSSDASMSSGSESSLSENSSEDCFIINDSATAVPPDRDAIPHRKRSRVDENLPASCLNINPPVISVHNDRSVVHSVPSPSLPVDSALPLSFRCDIQADRLSPANSEPVVSTPVFSKSSDWHTKCGINGNVEFANSASPEVYSFNKEIPIYTASPKRFGLFSVFPMPVPDEVCALVPDQFREGFEFLPQVRVRLPPVVPSVEAGNGHVLGSHVHTSKSDLESKPKSVHFGMKVSGSSQQIAPGLGIEEHCKQALHAVSPFDGLPRLPYYLQEVIDIHKTWTPEQIWNHRESMMSHIEDMAAAPEMFLMKDLWQASRPEHTQRINPDFHGPLFLHLHRLAGMDPTRCEEHLRNGFPLVGELPSFGLWNPREKPATLTPDELSSTSHERLPKMLEKVVKQKPEMASQTWAAHKKEASLGFVRGPFWLDSSREGVQSVFDELGVPQSSTNFVPRLGVPHNNEPNAARPIDDGRSSRVNEAASMSERAYLPSLDQYVSLLLNLMVCTSKLVQGADGDTSSIDVSQWSVSSDDGPQADDWPSLSDDDLETFEFKGDHDKAYKRWCAALRSILMTILIVLNTDSNLPEIWIQESLCFGAIGSVVGYCFLSLSLTIQMCRLLLIPILGYVDDYLGGDHTHRLAIQGFGIFVRLHQLLRVKLKEGKQVGPNSAMAALGLNVVLKSFQVVVSPSASRRDRLVEALTGVVSLERLAKGQAKRLAGQASFFASAIWGRLARPFISVLWSKTQDNASLSLNSAQIACLRCLLEVVKIAPPRVMSVKEVHPRNRVVCWSDAWVSSKTWCGGMAGVVVVLNDKNEAISSRAFQSMIPAEITSRWRSVLRPRHLQEQVEALAALTVLTTFEPELRGTSAIMFQDNRGVQGSLVKASSRNPLSAELVCAFWIKAFEADVQFWVESVGSKDNPMDAPSRAHHAAANLFGSRYVDAIVPLWALDGIDSILLELRKILSAQKTVDLLEL
jgi:hypothetical protein